MKLMTYEEVAEKWNVSIRTVERIVAEKYLKKTKLRNRTVRFKPSAVAEAEENLSI